MENSTTRFSNRVEAYFRYRPSYPAAILPFLEQNAGFRASSVVADIGSGTGISSELFLANGNRVLGVEPNRAMREKAEELLGRYEAFISIDGTAEHTSLEAESIDMIVAGQAFHWFDAAKAQAEFRRIARERAFCVLIWNERMVSSGFERAYEELLLEFATDYKKVDHRNVNEEKLTDFFAPNPFIPAIFPNEQVFDFDGVKGRLLSSSYVPDPSDPRFPFMIRSLRQIFDAYASQGRVGFSYQTKLYAGRMRVSP